ncbi:MAG: malonate transporter [Alteromonadaceae bacterium]|jgi:malonate transporter
MNIIDVISPLIFVGLVGFISTKTRWLDKTQIDTLTKFAFNLCIPAFLFQKLVNTDLAHVDIKIYAAFYIPVLLIYCIAGLSNYFFHQNHQKDTAASAIYALAASYSNNVIVGIPVVIMVLGEHALAIVFLIVSLHSAMLFGICSVLTSKAARFNWQSFIKQTFCNPLIIAILSGFIFNLLAIKLPYIVDESLSLIGRPAISLALFILGASLTFYRIKDEIKFICFASMLKLILLPLMVYLSAHYVFDFEKMTVTTLVILSACPTGVNAYLIAKQQIQHQQTVAGTVVASTIASMLTIPFWLWFLS